MSVQELPALGIEIVNDLSFEPSLQMRVVAYRVLLEALASVRKHASADNVTITLADQGDGFVVRIADDGIGFTAKDPEPGHLGLQDMRERAESAGGRLRIISAPSEGTTIEIWLPSDALSP